MKTAPLTDDAVAGPKYPLHTGKIRRTPRRTQAMSCKNGHPLCLDDSDDMHSCPRRTAPESPADVLARAVRYVAEGADDGLGTTLSGRACEALCEAFGIRRLAGGIGIAYEVHRHNPTFSQRVATIRSGVDICDCCQGVLTMSNRSVHGPGRCWPTPFRSPAA